MKPTTALILVIATAFVVGGCSGGEPPAPPSTVVEVTPELIAQGQKTYKMNCVPCHGPEGKGDGPSAASLNPKPRDHSNPQLMSTLTDKKIAETVRMGGIISGYPNMPASPHIKGEELVGLIAFVRSLHLDAVETVDVEGVGQEAS